MHQSGFRLGRGRESNRQQRELRSRDKSAGGAARQDPRACPSAPGVQRGWKRAQPQPARAHQSVGAQRAGGDGDKGARDVPGAKPQVWALGGAQPFQKGALKPETTPHTLGEPPQTAGQAGFRGTLTSPSSPTSKEFSFPPFVRQAHGSGTGWEQPFGSSQPCLLPTTKPQTSSLTQQKSPLPCHAALPEAPLSAPSCLIS